MKNLLLTAVITTLFIAPKSLVAQIDEVKMDKDLRVAAKVLETLTQGDDRLMMYGDNVEGNYIDGYGVIFSIGGGYSVFVGGNKSFTISKGSSGYVVWDSKDGDKPAAAKSEEKVESSNPDFEAVMIEFLADYSQMIGQLKPTDKIVVSTKKSDYLYVVTDEEKELETPGSHGLTAELLKKDHNDFVEGKITHDALIKKIVINRNNGENLRAKDLDLFSSMLKTIYDDAYTESFFISWKPEYERIKGVGAIYTFKVYSSYDENGLYRMPGIHEQGLTGQQRNERVEQLYPIFVESMKENIVQYGRTINSLEPNEVLLLRITMTKCDNCTIPSKVQFSIKQSDLAEYNAGKLAQEEAIARVKVTKL